MRILVTGGAGFIGSHLADRLVRDGIGDVRVLDNLSRGREEHLAQSRARVEFLRGDIRDRAQVEAAMRGVDVVYHLAAQSNVLGAVKDLDYSFETNVVGTYEVLRAAKAAGVRRVVFSSSREVYGEPEELPVQESATIAPKNAYGVSKAAGEMYCRLFGEQGMDVLVLRLANVYGTRDRDRVIPLFAEQSFSGRQLTVFGRNKVLDFLWIDDLVEVLLKAANGPCTDGPVNIGSGQGVNLVTVAERVCTLTGSDAGVQVTEERAPEVGRYVADVQRARAQFDLHCPNDPLEHLPAVVEYVRQQLLAGTAKEKLTS